MGRYPRDWVWLLMQAAGLLTAVITAAAAAFRSADKTVCRSAANPDKEMDE